MQDSHHYLIKAFVGSYQLTVALFMQTVQFI